jgi:hypothetical protein
MSWSSVLSSSSKLDSVLRILVASVFLLWCVIEGTHLEHPYSPTIVDFYSLPFTRLLLIIAVILLSIWCPRVGISAALAYAFLAADLNFFLVD